jgi:lipoate-protein ligase A
LSAESDLPPQSWRLLQTGFLTGKANMELDEALVNGLLGRGERQDLGLGDRKLPALRFYRWRPWAVSLGHHQREEDLDSERLCAEGIDLVRRPTGGRAILHAEEMTYSVVMPSGGRSVLQVYHAISRALVRGLRRLGVEVSLQRSQPNFPEAYRQPSAIPCFASSARYEIEWQGRKLVGSAQRRYGSGREEVVLQHGSILCGGAHQALVEYLRLPEEDLRERLRRDLKRSTTDLSAILGRAVDPEELVDPLGQAFEEEWGIVFIRR